MSMFCVGLSQGWMSPMTKILISSESPVGTLTMSEIGFVASLSSYMTFICASWSSYTANRFGRKNTLILAGIPSLMGGILLSVANTKMVLYLGRGLMGFSVVSISMAPMYFSETVHESIRGTLITFSNLSITFGILVSYSAFKFFSYKAVNYLWITGPAIFLFSMFFLPESPYYLASKFRNEAALKSMTWLRGGDVQSAKVELNTIKTGRGGNNSLNFLQSFKSKEAKSALLIGVTLFAIQTLSGIHIILNYAEMIFTKTEIPVSPDSAAIFVPVTILVATVVCLTLVDKIGRKPLLYFSCFVGFVSHLTLTVLLFLLAKGLSFSNIGILSAACVISFVFSYGAGMSGVPALILNEVSSIEIKSYVSTLGMLTSIVLNIGTLQTFPILTESIGIYVNFFVPTIANLFGIFFIWNYVPETKGKSLTEITKLLKKR